MADKPIIISSKPVHGPQPQSPDLSPDAPGLYFSVTPAVTQAGEATVALFAACLLPGRYADVYGGRAVGAVQIVAINTATGEVYHNGGERGHAAPISAVMKPAPKPPKPGQAIVDSIEVYFAVDLRAQLQLPKRSAVYSVFLWLDEIASSPHQVEVPGPFEETASSPANANFIAYKLVDGKPTASPKEIVLSEAAGLVAGEIGSDLFQPSGSNKPKYLSLLALDYRSRIFNWQSVVLPPAGSPGRNRSFQFSRTALFNGPGWLDTPEPPRHVFVLAALAETLSRVLVFSA